VKSGHRRFEAGGEYRRAIPRAHTDEEFGREKRVACEIHSVPRSQEEMLDLPRASVIEPEHQFVTVGRGSPSTSIRASAPTSFSSW
jgi:hypothetical protein